MTLQPVRDYHACSVYVVMAWRWRWYRGDASASKRWRREARAPGGVPIDAAHACAV